MLTVLLVIGTGSTCSGNDVYCCSTNSQTVRAPSLQRDVVNAVSGSYQCWNNLHARRCTALNSTTCQTRGCMDGFRQALIVVCIRVDAYFLSREVFSVDSPTFLYVQKYLHSVQTCVTSSQRSKCFDDAARHTRCRFWLKLHELARPIDVSLALLLASGFDWTFREVTSTL